MKFYHLFQQRCRLSLKMQSSIWCAAVICLVLLLAVHYGDGKRIEISVRAKNYIITIQTFQLE